MTTERSPERRSTLLELIASPASENLLELESLDLAAASEIGVPITYDHRVISEGRALGLPILTFTCRTEPRRRECCVVARRAVSIRPLLHAESSSHADVTASGVDR